MQIIRARALHVLSVALFAFGCSGPAGPGVSTDAVETDVSPFVEGRYLFIDETDAILHDLNAGTVNRLSHGGAVSYSSVSPNGAFASLAVTRATESQLMLIRTQDATVTELHKGSADLVYTGSWSPKGDAFAFGYYQPTVQNDRPALGAGDIMTVSLVSREISQVGCSASKAVISWPEEGELLVRATDNLYRVNRDGCGTLATMDIRRWHAISASPGGGHIAYIYRELSYNRDKGAYEPDSALYVMPASGGEAIKIVGDRYRPRHPVWSPDGSEIAFDVRIDPESEKRAISIYSLASNESTYLNPPTDTSPSRSQPIWNPGGTTVSFVENGDQLFVTSVGSSFSRAVPLGMGDRFASDLVGWLDSENAIVTDSSGIAWLFNTETQASERLGRGAAVGL